jgi:chromate reductase
MTGQTVKVLGIAGSLRDGSYNRMALATAVGLAPDGMTIEIYEGLGDIPIYNEDVKNAGIPAPVAALTERIRAADGLYIVSPEYNHSIPGVVKNAIDWLSRVPDGQPFKDKPAAIMGAAIGPLGTSRMQYQLRQVLGCLEAHVLHRPEIFIGNAARKFNEQGRLTDDVALGLIKQQLEALKGWIERLRA